MMPRTLRDVAQAVGGLASGEDVEIRSVVTDSRLVRPGALFVAMPGEPEGYAEHFYAVLRELDGMGLRTIYVEMPPDRPEWEAVRDRIRVSACVMSDWIRAGSTSALLSFSCSTASRKATIQAGRENNASTALARSCGLKPGQASNNSTGTPG